MIAQGKSLSGRERNCCFLNVGQNQFADVSAVSGFDFPDDTRAVAVTDWDQDGDLDIWLTNRTANRVRFLRNTCDAASVISIQLQGTTSNRDAIGARVQLHTDQFQHVRALRAGEGYLSQSTKWLHFGMNNNARVQEVSVLWPTGIREQFSGEFMPGGRYTLVEGSGNVVSKRQRARVELDDSPREAGQQSRPAAPTRLVVPSPLPLPGLTYQNFDGEQVPLQGDASTLTIVHLWATWCQPCILEMKQWAQREQDFADVGARVVLLCVADVDESASATSEKAQKLLEQLRIPFEGGLATVELLETLDTCQFVLTKRVSPMMIPTTFLIDRKGRLAATYKGETPSELLLGDIRSFKPATSRREQAVPFHGSWYTNPFPPDVLAIPKRYLSLARPDKALDYLQQIHDDLPSAELLPRSHVARIYADIARSLDQRSQADQVVDALKAAARLEPNDIRTQLSLALFFQHSKRYAAAAEQYRQILEKHPNDPLTANNFAWMLATCPDTSVRQPDAAIRFANIAVSRSQRKLPAALDTLAAAYASARRFEEAVSTIQEAISLLENANADAAALQARRSLYVRREIFVEQ